MLFGLGLPGETFTGGACGFQQHFVLPLLLLNHLHSHTIIQRKPSLAQIFQLRCTPIVVVFFLL